MFFTISGFFAVLSFLCLLPLKRERNEQQREHFSQTERKERNKVIEPTILPIGATICVIGMGFSAISTLLSLHAREIGNVNLASYFYFLMVCMMLLTRPITGKIFDKRGSNAVMYPSFIVYALGIFVLAMASSAPIFLISSIIVGLGYAAIFPGLQILTLNAAPFERQGLAISTFFLFFDLGMTIGSSLFAFIASKIGYNGMFFTCSVSILLGMILYFLADKYTAKGERKKLLTQLQNKEL